MRLVPSGVVWALAMVFAVGSCKIKDGVDGSSCTVKTSKSGTKTLSCTDGTQVVIEDGQDGVDGESCTVARDDAGRAVISCEDGTRAKVSDGKDGSCSVSEGDAGIAILSCDDGTSVTIATCALGSFRCTDDTLEQCTEDGWVEQEQCEPDECQADERRCGPADGAVRLVGGVDESQGRVEIYHNGQWGTICDDVFADDDKAAKVVCRQLGYARGKAECCGYLGVGTGVILMDEVRCDGSESSLLECVFPGWGVAYDCTHGEDVGVLCSG
ncbi:MAG: scavenger receptor cysteine-rich domain-containing protein [Polyangiaceae bacterium]|nr:scavenger receptor cysteine-rich domain-containing protein [Polyangiaceae bacterium]